MLQPKCATLGLIFLILGLELLFGIKSLDFNLDEMVHAWLQCNELKTVYWLPALLWDKQVETKL